MGLDGEIALLIAAWPLAENGIKEIITNALRMAFWRAFNLDFFIKCQLSNVNNIKFEG
jgi:hypothetical protein